MPVALIAIFVVAIIYQLFITILHDEKLAEARTLDRDLRMKYRCCRCGNKANKPHDLCYKCKKILKGYEREEKEYKEPTEIKGKVTGYIQ